MFYGVYIQNRRVLIHSVGAEIGKSLHSVYLRIAEAASPVMHWYCHVRRKIFLHFQSARGVYGEKSAYGHHQHIHAAEFFASQFRKRVAYVAHVHNAHSAEFNNRHGVFPAFCTVFIVVEGVEAFRCYGRLRACKLHALGIEVVVVAVAAYAVIRPQRRKRKAGRNRAPAR